MVSTVLQSVLDDCPDCEREGKSYIFRSGADVTFFADTGNEGTLIQRIIRVELGDYVKVECKDGTYYYLCPEDIRIVRAMSAQTHKAGYAPGETLSGAR